MLDKTVSSQDTPLDTCTHRALLPIQKQVLLLNIWSRNRFSLLQMPLDSVLLCFLYIYLLNFVHTQAPWYTWRGHRTTCKSWLSLPIIWVLRIELGCHDCQQEPLITETACKLYSLFWFLFFLKQHETELPNCFMPVTVFLPLVGLLGRA